jgi:hypothetical protein
MARTANMISVGKVVLLLLHVDNFGSPICRLSTLPDYMQKQSCQTSIGKTPRTGTTAEVIRFADWRERKVPDYGKH